MGEANYFLKARFRDAEAAADAVPPLAALLVEGDHAYHYWQSNRGFNAPSSPPDAAAHWAEFRRRFPLTTRYLGRHAGDPDWVNGPAGKLGSLVAPGRRATLACNGDLLLLRLDMIWHCSDMELLEDHCRKALGAVAVGSLSDDYAPDESVGGDETDEDFEARRGAVDWFGMIGV